MAAKVLNLDVTFVTKNITVSRDFIFIGMGDSSKLVSEIQTLK